MKHVRLSVVVGSLVAAAALGSNACSGKVVAPPPDGGSTSVDDAGSTAPDAGGEVVDAGPWGYDARPANPTCVAPPRPTVQSGVTVARAFPNLTFSVPMLLSQAPGDNGRLFVMERAGRIRAFPNDESAAAASVTTVLDISAKVNTSGEGGMLGMAFHPDWANRKELYLSYTRTGPGNGTPLISVISRVTSSDNGATFDPASEEILLELNQPYANHNGGGIGFGPDNYLYIGFGDGGSGGDPLNAGQRTNTLLGKFLRIDVNVPAAQKYGIPAANPYASTGAPCNLTSSAHTNTSTAFCAEIFAIGFRNPWRWSFDTATGELWVGDVGQNAWEEVDRVVVGGNYGWKIREGAHCYGATTCNTAGLIEPIVEYDHGQGNSITGGYVYRGTRIPSLVGRFVFGDYGSGRIWAVAQDPSTGAYSSELLQDTNIAIGSFGQTHDGELYVLGLSTGQIHRLDPSAQQPPDSFPQLLSKTGCFSGGSPVAGMIPFDVNAALWSDGADKERYLAIPDGTTITVNADGDWDFPNGTVLAKTFSMGGKRVETRLFMRHPDGTWAGYTYEWNDAQTDAALLPAAKTKQVGDQSWYFPSRAQCMTCHTAAAGRALAPETAQLNRSITYPTGRTRNQLTTLDGLGFFNAPLNAADPAQLPRYEDPLGTGPLDARARAYLHANCSNCHREGAGQGPQDFRASLSLAAMNACDVAPVNGELGVTNARIIAPGDPARSIASVRMHALNAYRMPPLASSRVDAEGVAMIDQWITSLTGCAP